jgi:hypothetical protein
MMKSPQRIARVAGVLAACLAVMVGCAASQMDSAEFPSAGQRLTAEQAAIVDREECVDVLPDANTIREASRVDRLAERCRQDALASEQKLAAALQEAVAGSGESEGGAGAGGAAAEPVDVNEATAQLRTARQRLAAATHSANRATERLEAMNDALFEARLWRVGIGFHGAAAAAAGDRTLQRLGGSLLLRVNPTFELDFSLTRDWVTGLALDKQKRTSARAIALIGRGHVAMALGAGAGVTAPDENALPIIGHVGLTFRLFPHLGCREILGVTDLSVFAEHWHVNADALAAGPPTSPVFFGASLTVAFAGSRVGEERFLKLDGTTPGCVP